MRPAELNLRILWSIARYVADVHGAESLDRICAASEISPAELDGRSKWISHEQFEKFLAGARDLMSSDEEFKKSCVHRLREGYGPIKYVLFAVSPSLMYSQLARTMPLVSSISKYEIVESGPNFTHARYTSKKNETRLMCMSRTAQMASLPTLWGLPPADLRETSCLAQGDASCDYHLRWYEKRGFFRPIVSTVLGTVGAGLFFGATNIPALIASAVALGAFALIYEMHRTSRANMAVASHINEALITIAREDAQARQEILAFHQREREWSRLLEEQVNDRTDSLHKVVDRIQIMREAREETLRGVSHDLRNPLSVLKLAAQWMEGRDYLLGADGRKVLADQQRSIAQMERLLTELMHVASSEEVRVHLTMQTLDVTTLPEKLRGRLRALVLGRNVRTSVLRTREAPAKIDTDILLFDRVLDNLLTNAAKYTERGSILVEVGGTPGFLTIKISDTGRGIDSEQISRIFQPGGSEESLRAPNSFGVGLSVVVRLLAQVGGRLEVMSRPGEGTTFWAHFPEMTKAISPITGAPTEELLDKVVTIRRTIGS